MFHFEPPLTAPQRDQVGCVVLGRGADKARVRAWLTVAAGVAGFIGFAVGRTSFWDVVSGYRAQTLTRAETSTQIAGQLRKGVGIFKAARSEPPAPPALSPPLSPPLSLSASTA